MPFLLFDDKQRPHALGGIAIDFTQRKLAEAELRQTKEHLDQLVEARTATLGSSTAIWRWKSKSGARRWISSRNRKRGIRCCWTMPGMAWRFCARASCITPIRRWCACWAQQVDQVMWRSFLEFIDPAQREFIADNIAAAWRANRWHRCMSHPQTLQES